MQNMKKKKLKKRHRQSSRNLIWTEFNLWSYKHNDTFFPTFFSHIISKGLVSLTFSRCFGIGLPRLDGSAL